jgi:hypothetical protein
MVKVSKKGVVVLVPDNICLNITNDMFKPQTLIENYSM